VLVALLQLRMPLQLLAQAPPRTQRGQRQQGARRQRGDGRQRLRGQQRFANQGEAGPFRSSCSNVLQWHGGK